MSENHIVKAFNEGKPIRHKSWGEGEWIVKISEKRSMSQYGDQQDPTAVFKKHPNEFEVVKEDNNEKFEHLAVINPFSKFNLNDVPVPSETPKEPILEAYEIGLKIRQKDWHESHWIQKIDEEKFTNNYGEVLGKKYFFEKATLTASNNWELYIEPEMPTQPKTPRFIDSIQQAIDLLKDNGYEIYKIEKTKL